MWDIHDIWGDLFKAYFLGWEPQMHKWASSMHFICEHSTRYSWLPSIQQTVLVPEWMWKHAYTASINIDYFLSHFLFTRIAETCSESFLNGNEEKLHHYLVKLFRMYWKQHLRNHPPTSRLDCFLHKMHTLIKKLTKIYPLKTDAWMMKITFLKKKRSLFSGHSFIFGEGKMYLNNLL